MASNWSFLCLVPREGATSNSETQLLAEWKKNNKNKSEAPELELSSDIEQLFDTLAQWNEYLEKYVPYFSEPQDPEEPQP